MSFLGKFLQQSILGRTICLSGWALLSFCSLATTFGQSHTLQQSYRSASPVIQSLHNPLAASYRSGNGFRPHLAPSGQKSEIPLEAFESTAVDHSMDRSQQFPEQRKGDATNINPVGYQQELLTEAQMFSEQFQHQDEHCSPHGKFYDSPTYQSYQKQDSIGYDPVSAYCPATPGFPSYCEPASFWTARLETVLMSRSEPNSSAPFLGLDGGATSVAGEDLDFDLMTGYRFTVNYQQSAEACWIHTASWFHLPERHQQRSFTGTGLQTGSQNIGDGTASIRYETELSNLQYEFGRYISPWTKLAVGARWMNLEEAASLAGTGTLGTTERTSFVDNNLYGVTGAIERNFYDKGGNLTIDLLGRSGVYLNRIHTKQSYRDSQTGTNRLISARQSEAGFASEAGITATYRLLGDWSLTGSYRILYVHEVGLAVDQLTRPLTANLDRGSVYYQGAEVGLQRIW